MNRREAKISSGETLHTQIEKIVLVSTLIALPFPPGGNDSRRPDFK